MPCRPPLHVAPPRELFALQAAETGEIPKGASPFQRLYSGRHIAILIMQYKAERIMNPDLTAWLTEWPHEPGSVAARRVQCNDGKPRLQLRVDLGILQMNEHGRPDGRRPHGYATLLDYHQTLARTSPPGALGPLTQEECAALQLEAAQFYHRYLAYSALGELPGVVEDCAHNLAIIDLVLTRAQGQPAADALAQLYPFVRMMHARAKAELFIDGDAPDQAAKAIQQAIRDIRALARREGLEEPTGHLREIEALTSLLVSLRNRKIEPLRERLERQLEQAVSEEDFERAARLRDALRVQA